MLTLTSTNAGTFPTPGPRQRKKGLMQSKLVVLLLLGSAWTSVHSEDQKPKMHWVCGNPSNDFVATLQTIESPANRWKPGEEPLPIDVAEFGRTAKQHLLRRRPEIPASATLISMEISPYPFPM